MTFNEFLDEICNDPENWDLRKVFADWLTDQGRQDYDYFSECMRWMAKNHKRAAKIEIYDIYDWWNKDRLKPYEIEEDPKSVLPQVIFNCLNLNSKRFRFQSYKTRKDSELAVLYAWGKSRINNEINENGEIHQASSGSYQYLGRFFKSNKEKRLGGK